MTEYIWDGKQNGIVTIKKEGYVDTWTADVFEKLYNTNLTRLSKQSEPIQLEFAELLDEDLFDLL
jgi:hypothetical protein